MNRIWDTRVYGHMCTIHQFSFSNNTVQSVVVAEQFWCRGNDVAIVLGYARPRKAVMDHVIAQFKITNESFISVGRHYTGRPYV